MTNVLGGAMNTFKPLDWDLLLITWVTWTFKSSQVYPLLVNYADFECKPLLVLWSDDSQANLCGLNTMATHAGGCCVSYTVPNVYIISNSSHLLKQLRMSVGRNMNYTSAALSLTHGELEWIKYSLKRKLLPIEVGVFISFKATGYI